MLVRQAASDQGRAVDPGLGPRGARSLRRADALPRPGCGERRALPLSGPSPRYFAAGSGESSGSSVAFRYLGNKSRLASWICGQMADVLPAGCRVADPMCGTAAVSRALADTGFVVSASDELRFPVLHAQARLLYDRPYDFSPVARSYEDALAQLNKADPEQGVFWREYGEAGTPLARLEARRYFTAANAARIDAIRRMLREWRAAGLAPSAADLLLHDLILAVNAVANISGTYGFYLANFTPASLRPLVLAPSPLVPPDPGHSVLQGKVEEVAGHIDIDACYLDPPYTKRQYAGNYHVLETLACEDEPTAIGDGGLREWRDQASAFCYKRLAPQALRDAVKRLEVPHIFLSYSEDGQIPPDEVLSILCEFGPTRRVETDHQRYRSNGRGAAGAVREHLYILERR